MGYFLTLTLLSALGFAPSLLATNGSEYHTIEAQQQKLPVIKLPYGRWQAAKYDAINDLYIFKNIRFAAPPIGPLRWAKPAPPEANDTLQRGNYGFACPQSVPMSMFAGTGIFGFVMGTIGKLIDFGPLTAGAETGEDCLFLDVYAPAKALNGSAKLPIVNWIYGGAYLMGSKEGSYDGTPVVRASGGNVIYVAGNYRVGAFGFLAGATVERFGTPNAGLWDQRAVLEWIQKYGSLFGGDIDNVSVWGESAGAGSITHHLTAFGGKKPALFKRAVIQSSAFDPQPDRRGQLERQFYDFATLAGCKGQGMNCLRAVDLKTLKAAQDQYVSQMPGGKPGFGPAADGDLVRQLPVLELATGNVVKGIDTIINSHVLDEAEMFVPSAVDDGVVDAVLHHFYGTSVITKDGINGKYSSISDAKKRIKQLYQFSTFTCHNRWITEGFKGKTYNLQYSRGSGNHGSDISADFYNGWSFSFADWTWSSFAATFQSYLTSHARTGNPNRFRDKNGIDWPLVTFGPTLTNVLDASDKGFRLVADQKTKAEDCDFWKDALAGMTNSLGYAPPDAVVHSSMVLNPGSNASAKYDRDSYPEE